MGRRTSAHAAARGFRACGGLVAAACALSTLAAGTAPLKYALSAPDGVPGAYRVTLTPQLIGTWRISAQWTGRALAGLWIEDEQGRSILRVVGASPQSIDLSVDGNQIPVESKLIVRFSPYTAGGALSGEIEIDPPRAEGEAPIVRSLPTATAAAPPAPSNDTQRLRGPGACLAASRTTPAADDGAARALQSLAEALESAKPGERDWVVRWTGQFLNSLEKDAGDVRTARKAIDLLWEQMELDPAPSETIARPFRGVLAELENLIRREERAHSSEGAAAQRRLEVTATLGCLLPAPKQ